MAKNRQAEEPGPNWEDLIEWLSSLGEDEFNFVVENFYPGGVYQLGEDFLLQPYSNTGMGLAESLLAKQLSPNIGKMPELSSVKPVLGTAKASKYYTGGGQPGFPGFKNSYKPQGSSIQGLSNNRSFGFLPDYSVPTNTQAYWDLQSIIQPGYSRLGGVPVSQNTPGYAQVTAMSNKLYPRYTPYGQPWGSPAPFGMPAIKYEGANGDGRGELGAGYGWRVREKR